MFFNIIDLKINKQAILDKIYICNSGMKKTANKGVIKMRW